MFCSNSAELRAWAILHLGDLCGVIRRSTPERDMLPVLAGDDRLRIGLGRSDTSARRCRHTRLFCPPHALPFRAWRAERKAFVHGCVMAI
jgi:hypothetical protein